MHEIKRFVSKYLILKLLLIVPLVDFFHGTALTISTSLTSKIVDNEKLGK